MQLLRKLLSIPRPYAIAGAVAWGVLILCILLLPSSSVPHLRIPHADKAVHAGMFFVLAYFVWFAITTEKRSARPFLSAATTFLLTVGYGGLTEYIQLSAATRTADIYDAVADAAGAALFLWIVPRLRRRLPATRVGS